MGFMRLEGLDGGYLKPQSRLKKHIKAEKVETNPI
jgi:hypothetical protein